MRDDLPAPDLTVEDARRVLAAQPFSALLGATLVEFKPGTATLALDFADHLRQQHGFVHGGVLAYLADNAITFAGGSVLGPAVLTAGISVKYVAPARGSLRATAEVVTVAGRTATCRCEIASDGIMCAVAEGSVRRTGKAQGDEQVDHARHEESS
jgi:uncharacterized protein (TIGR00369 family)